MKWLLAIFLPPLAVLMTGRVFSAVINLGLTLCLWLPGVIHAIAILNEQDNKKRHKEVLREMRR